MSDQQTSSAIPTVPNTWPGAFGLYKYSRDAVRFNLGTIVGLLVLSVVGTAVINSLGGNTAPNKNIFALISDLVSVWFSAAMVFAVLASLRSTRISLGDSLSKAGGIYLKFLILTVLMFAAIITSLVLLIVPFFFVMPRLVMAPYYLVDKNMDPLEALQASWANSKGHVGKVWGIIGATIAMSLLIVVLVGVYFLVMYSAAMALLYMFVNKSAK